MKRIIRIIQVPCFTCLGTGRAFSGECPTCHGYGEVDRRIVEIVHDEEDEQAQAMLKNAGSVT